MPAIPEPARAMLDEQRLAFVATVNDDGTPNLSPKGTLAAYDLETLVFADLASPRTVANLRARPATAVNVVDPLSRKGYRFDGRGEVVEPTDPDWGRLTAFLDARGLRNAAARTRAVVRVRVLRTRPLVSPAYDSGLTEAELRERWAAHYKRLAAGERVDDPERIA